jgi:helicase
MRVSELSLEERFKGIYREGGFSELYPPQEAAVSAGLLGAGNMILSTPTASGKTFAAELAIAKALSSGRKAVYVVPLRALAFEKHQEFRKYEKLGYAVRLEVGDLDSKKYAHKPRFDILVATAEKCDSIMRAKPERFRDVGLLVLDEIHLIGSDRGPVYEVLTTKLRVLYPNIRVLGLSATIGNPQELSSWLSAKLVSSEWRPVELSEEVVVSRGFETLKEEVLDALSSGGQVLVFVNSRKSAESVAEKLGEELALREAGLEKLSEEILDALSSPTSQCLRLSGCVKHAVAFHHAGLVNAQRNLIEDSFRDGRIKVIVATPTLAAGVNLPARTVIIRDLKRFDVDSSDYIPVFEYKQMSGRAGRPKYDAVGYAVSLSKSESEREFIIENYVYGEPEPIYSRLGVEPVLRSHALAQIASAFTRTEKALTEFFRQTFYGFQYGVSGDFEVSLRKILGDLVSWGFVGEKDRFIIPTPIGNRVSELYIDPLTAHTYLTHFSEAEKKKTFPEAGLLEVLCDASEMRPLQVKSSEEGALWAQAYSMEKDFLRDIGGFGLDWQFLPRFKTTKMFLDWIHEKTEEHILETYAVAPGQLHQHLQIMEWLAYSASELSRLSKLNRVFLELKKLETRIKYGISGELMPLVTVKGIGRVRARKLYAAGITSPEKLRAEEPRKLTLLLGEKTAKKILEELQDTPYVVD